MAGVGWLRIPVSTLDSTHSNGFGFPFVEARWLSLDSGCRPLYWSGQLVDYSGQSAGFSVFTVVVMTWHCIQVLRLNRPSKQKIWSRFSHADSADTL